MTPANIAGMAYIKGLALISLTDHNSGANLPAMAHAAADRGLIFVPGAEVTTREEVHMLTYFADLDAAMHFTGRIYESLPDIANRPDIFGNQLMMDEADTQTGTLGKLLIQATPYSLEDIVSMALAADGVAVPAHINRDAFSLIPNLGLVPPGLFHYVEVAHGLSCPPLDPVLQILTSSDAHTLGDIAEPLHHIGVSSASELIARLRGLDV